MKKLLSASLSTTLLYLVLAQPAFANRPAMNQPDTNTETSNGVEQSINRSQQPSSVELMMQQENSHTGDVLALPAKEMQPGETIRVKLLNSPRRGMSMNKVKNELGQPATMTASIGEPPITRWIYNDRIVYFEYSTVIHVVAR